MKEKNMSNLLNAVPIPVSILKTLLHKHELAIVGYDEFDKIQELYDAAINNDGYIVSDSFGPVILLPACEVKHLLTEHKRSVVDYAFMSKLTVILKSLGSMPEYLYLPPEPTPEIISISLEGKVFPAYLGSDESARESFRTKYLEVIGVIKKWISNNKN